MKTVCMSGCVDLFGVCLSVLKKHCFFKAFEAKSATSLSKLAFFLEIFDSLCVMWSDIAVEVGASSLSPCGG